MTDRSGDDLEEIVVHRKMEIHDKCIVSKIKITEQDVLDNMYVLFEFTINGKFTNVEMRLEDLLTAFMNDGDWYDANTHTNDSQIYEDYIKEESK